MNHEEYKTKALATAFKPDAAMREVLSNTNLYGHLWECMDAMAELSEHIDKLKKHIFYKTHPCSDDLRAELVAVPPAVRREIPLEIVDDDDKINLLHAIVGKASEMGEIIKAIKPNFTIGAREPLDIVNFHEEIGDDEWYTAFALAATEGNMEEIWQRNIDKLMLRHQKRGVIDDGTNRDLVAERRILDGSDAKKDEQ